ncbi:hypothetical protein phytr_1020 [Candidatus Phycorickettsia trachydisci]|uniref:PD-(D/E)XK nuclease family transposase n=1 Tax=Candidatus Phycorickettsia trachydisci TaxID=2115978 RepID=A0A2P1P714_9RICK|nr:Rpn family recombination-promoting nuclease/putative transposase [Candidatus Phycorickettsia trachydisci]AVP87063.1 hypothetical protein phytr_1020 [Candidatus Phycorickettsia trachydisci]
MPKRKFDDLDTTDQDLEAVVRAEVERLNFADPTNDLAFKILLGNNEYTQIPIHFLNTLLGFEGDNAITELVSLSVDLQKFSLTEVRSAVDIKCITSSGKEIAIEMQKRHKDYFLSRMQTYMSLLTMGHVQRGDSAKYHLKLRDTYILIIAKENIFKGQDAIFKDGVEDDSYEKVVVPCIKGLGQEVPQNKLHWVFFELDRFAESIAQKKREEYTPKEQWLDFLLNCPIMTSIPSDIDPIIQNAYRVMKNIMEDPAKREEYISAELKKAEDEREIEKNRAEGKAEGIIEGKLEDFYKALVIPLQHEFLTKIFGSTFNEEKITAAEKYMLEHPTNHSLDDVSKLLLGETLNEAGSAENMSSS